MKTLLHGHKAMGVPTKGHTDYTGLLSQAKSSQANCYLLYFILILLTSPDNVVSDTTRKIMYLHIQVETPQQQAPILLQAQRE